MAIPTVHNSCSSTAQEQDKMDSVMLPLMLCKSGVYLPAHYTKKVYMYKDRTTVPRDFEVT